MGAHCFHRLTLKEHPTEFVVACGGGVVETEGGRAALKAHWPVVQAIKPIEDITAYLGGHFYIASRRGGPRTAGTLWIGTWLPTLRGPPSANPQQRPTHAVPHGAPRFYQPSTLVGALPSTRARRASHACALARPAP